MPCTTILMLPLLALSAQLVWSADTISFTTDVIPIEGTASGGTIEVGLTSYPERVETITTNKGEHQNSVADKLINAIRILVKNPNNPSRSDNQIRIGGGTPGSIFIRSVSETGIVTIPKVEGLTATVNANSTQVSLSWTKPPTGRYDSIQLRVNGSIITTLDPSSTTFTHHDGSTVKTGGLYTLVGFNNTGMVSDVSVVAGNIDRQEAGIPAVQAVQATHNAQTNQVTISWTIPPGTTYDDMSVTADGEEIAELAGTSAATVHDLTNFERDGATITYKINAYKGNKSAEAQITIKVP